MRRIRFGWMEYHQSLNNFKFSTEGRLHIIMFATERYSYHIQCTAAFAQTPAATVCLDISAHPPLYYIGIFACGYPSGTLFRIRSAFSRKLLYSVFPGSLQSYNIILSTNGAIVFMSHCFYYVLIRVLPTPTPRPTQSYSCRY